MVENTPTQKKNNSPVLIILCILLLIICLAEGWMLLNQKKQIEYITVEKTDIEAERNSIKQELNSMLEQYEALKTDNKQMQAQVEEQKAKIEQLLKEAEKHKGDAWVIHKLRKETETLRTIMKGFVRTIDSLNILNQTLTEEKAQVTTQLKQQQTKNEELAKSNEDLNSKVTIASLLKATGMRAFGVKVKGDNTGKELDKAKRIDKIRCCFKLAENKITPSGKKWIYLRILAPDGKVLADKSDESNMFEFNGVKGLFSSKKQIDYQNQEMELCLDWAAPNDKYEFSAGEYIIEIYADATDIGRTKLTLK